VAHDDPGIGAADEVTSVACDWGVPANLGSPPFTELVLLVIGIASNLILSDTKRSYTVI
jgi:hypothetical protein